MQAIKKRKSTEYACFTFPWDFRTVVVGGAILPWCIHQLILIQTRMVGYKYPHPMPFPAPSPAIASSAAKGVCASIHYSRLLLIWWVALLVFKIPSLFWLLQLHLLVYYNIDGWMDDMWCLFWCTQGRMVKVGPWGGNGGNVWDMGQADHITKLRIYYGDNIVGLEITYILNGNSHTYKRGTTTGASKEVYHLYIYVYINTHSSTSCLCPTI